MIRTEYQLNEALDKSLAWRRRELVNLNLLLQSLKREHERAALRRAALPLLYAHWEGFVKEAATSYLEFLSRSGVKCRDVQTSILALACRSAIKESAASERPHIHSHLIDFIILNQNDPLRLPWKDVVNTRSNLNSEVLRDIFWMTALPYQTALRTKEPLIDGSLLARRNAVVHGRVEPIDEPTFEGLHSLVGELLDIVRTSISNAAALKQYLR